MREILFISILMCVSRLSTFSQLPPALPEYELVFFDEFDTLFPGTVVDTSKWARTPEWNQCCNVIDTIFYCDSTSYVWDENYIIRDMSDTSTVYVHNDICELYVIK